MLKVAYASVGTVGVEFAPLCVLTTHLGRELASWSGLVYTVSLSINLRLGDVVFLHLFAKGLAIHTDSRTIDESALVEFAENTEDTTCTSALLHTVFLCVGSKFAETRHLAAQCVDVAHLEFGTSLLCHSQEMKHGVSASAHSDVECHGIEESLACGNALGQYTLVAILIICHRVLHNLTSSVAEELYAVFVSGKDSTVARKRETDSLGEGVH